MVLPTRLLIAAGLLALIAVTCAGQPDVMDPASHTQSYQATREVLLQRATIDTARVASTDFKETATGLWLVQLKSTAIERTKRAVQLIVHHELDLYIPHNTFIVACSTQEASLLRQTEGVLWVGVFRSTYKVSESAEQAFCSMSDSATVRELSVIFAPKAVPNIDTLNHLASVWESTIGVQMLHGSTPDVASFAVPCSAVASAVRYLSAQSAVLWVERRHEATVLNYYARGTTQSGGGPTETPIWNRGLQGQNQIVGCADTGLEMRLCWFNDPSQTFAFNTMQPTQRKVVYYETLVDSGAAQGAHGTHVAGSIMGQCNNATSPSVNYDGMARQAKMFFQDIGDAAESLTLPSDLAANLFTKPYQNGARIHSNSWGAATNTYTTNARDVDRFSWSNQDMLILFAAGNSGENGLYSLGSPGTAKNALTVGASMSSAASWGQVLAATSNNIQLNSPPGVAINSIKATFGPSVTSSITASFALASPEDGCNAIVSVSGKICLVYRGTCGFQQKVLNAQAAGAVAVVVIENTNDIPFQMGSTAGLATPVVPAMMVSSSDGAALVSYLGASASATATITAAVTANVTGSIYYSQNNLAYFSSRGPAYDGRIKPEVVAPGQYIYSANAPGTSNTIGNCSVTALQGTSMATPVTAGNAALIRQYFESGYYPSGVAVSADGFNPAGALVKAMLINSAVTLTGGIASQAIPTPINGSPSLMGFGRIQLDKILYFNDSNFNLFVANRSLITASGSYQRFCFNVNPTSTPFKVTAVWHDYYGTSNSLNALVNDLNLVVVGPSATAWIGNQPQRGNVWTFDANNNAEQVVVPAGSPIGQYAVTVFGANVPQGPQPFSLVATGSFTNLASCTLMCPANCSGNGVCDSSTGQCTCTGLYAGADCSQAVTLLAANTDVKVDVAAYQWRYFAFDVQNTTTPVSFQFSRDSGAGDPDMYLRFGALPTTQFFTASETACDPCGTTTHSIPIQASALSVGRYYFGIYGYCCDASSVSVSVTRTYVTSGAAAGNFGPSALLFALMATLLSMLLALVLH